MSDEPYYERDGIALYHGDCREILPTLNIEPDLILADPPYGTTAHPWDVWPTGWVDALPPRDVQSLWLWLPERVLFERMGELVVRPDHPWTYRQMLVWEKHNGTGAADGRLLRVHETCWHFTLGPWSLVFHETPREAVFSADKSVRRMNPDAAHRRKGRAHAYVDDGQRAVRSVIKAPSVRYVGRNPTEKPLAVQMPLIKGYCPPGGLVLDPFAGSGSALESALALGRRAVGVELREEQCEQVAQRLAQQSLVIA